MSDVITPLSIATRLLVGDVSSYLAVADSFRQRLYRGNNLGNDKHYLLIFMVTNILRWHYAIEPDDPTLEDTTNYLMWLCGKYKKQALSIIDGGGGGSIIIVDDTGDIKLIPFSFEILINSADYPSGQTYYEMFFRCFGTKNTDIYVELQNQPVTARTLYTAGDFTYAITYNADNAVIDFAINGVPTAPNDDQVMVIRGFKYV